MRKILKLLMLVVFFVTPVLKGNGQRNYPPDINGAKEVIYKTVDNIELKMWIFYPEDYNPGDKRSAIVFFFGGGWRSGSPEQFVNHCAYFSSRGMVAMVADYRVRERHNTLAVKCVADTKSAVRWIRENAKEIGVDPNRIVAGGGSAGGHLAAATALLPLYDEPEENSLVSSVPNAVALFNPLLIVAPIDKNIPGFYERFQARKDRLGANAKTMSPYHNIKEGVPPTIIFHGTADSTVLFETTKIFTQKMRDHGNTCNLVAYIGEAHGFFNHGKKDNGTFVHTVNKLDSFLVSLGFLTALPKTFEE